MSVSLHEAQAGIGVDIGGSSIKTAILSAGRLSPPRTLPVSAATPADLLWTTLSDEINRLLRTATNSGLGVLGIGVGVPCQIHGADGVLSGVTNLPLLEGVPAARRLRALLGSIPLHLDNDNNLGGYAEYRVGAGQGANRLLYVGLGTGVSASLIAEGRLVRYTGGYLGETGHLVVEPSGPTCSCGGRGCLEEMCSERAVVRFARVRGLACNSGEQVAVSAEGGNVDAQAALAEAGRFLGIGLASLVHLYSPDCIVIGGGLALSGHWLLDPARKTLDDYLGERYRGSFRLVPTALNRWAPLHGAALAGLYPGSLSRIA